VKMTNKVHHRQAVTIAPNRNSWQSLLDSLNAFSDDFMESRQQPEQQTRTCRPGDQAAGQRITEALNK
jgi:hypothetical protein